MASTEGFARLQRLVQSVLALALLQIGWGAYTRGSGSGFGCADRWPLCEGGVLQVGSYGGLLPAWQFEMIVEWTHRWIALLLLVGIVVAARRAVKSIGWVRGITAPLLIAVVVVFAQAGLGALVVLTDLDRDLVAVHLATAMLLLALLVTATTHLRLATGSTTSGAQSGPYVAQSSQRRALYGLAGIAAATLLLGSVTHNFHAFDGWPIPDGGIWPEFAVPRQALHYAHRIAAGLGWFLVLGLTVSFARTRPAAESRLLMLAATAWTLNVGLGAVHVFTRVGSTTAIVAHLTLAATVWAALIGVIVLHRQLSAGPDVLASQVAREPARSTVSA